MTDYQLHPLCSLFPRMDAEAFNALRNDIDENGLRQPITLHEGMILDGGNRYRACLDVGVTPVFVEFAGSNIVSFVFSANLHRRHLSPGQQAAIVASAQDWAKAEFQGGDRKSDSAKIKVQDCTLITSEQRAAESGASIRTQKMADKVAKASPELAMQVAHGEKSLPQAVEELTGKRPGARQAAPVEDDAMPAPLPAGMVQIEQDRLDELRANLQEALDDNNSLGRVFDSSDPLSVALEEAKRYREMNRVLESRIAGLMNEKNTAIRAAKNWQAKFLKLEKQLAAA